eukprot:PITA_31554
MWSGMNATFITLIPKTNNSEEAQGFRPIALCNVIYKIIATLVAKRLKPLLPSIISPEQTGFVEGRKILDGLVVAQEMIHSLNQHKRKGMMIKLDLSKAYDRLNWRYLCAVLAAYDFEKRWIEWIFSMVSTPIFSILVNSNPSKPFNASRGIRQGDPLSPFLFILAADGLGRIIKRESRRNKLRGLKLWGNNLAITHQQFVDDIMLFGEVSLREVRIIKEVLEVFSEASGMEINKDKSCTFIFNTPEAIKAHLTRTLGFKQGELPTKYLGNQLDIHPTRMKNWQEGGKTENPKHPKRIINLEFGKPEQRIDKAVCIWEIRGGEKAKFWEDGWQQKRKMNEIQTLQDLQQRAQRLGMDNVKDYWVEEENREIWRKWKKPGEWTDNINREIEEGYLREMDLRKIRNRTGEDILRWGKTMRGSFTVKEAYFLTTRRNQDEEDQDWKKIWEGKWWPKVTIFAWLVRKGKILTWDKIIKRGFQGPSRCSLCNREAENQEHLLNKCPFAESIWEKIRGLFGRTMRDQTNIRLTIGQWGTGKFHSKVVRRIWSLAVGFVIWFIWKERNKRIFRGQNSRPEKVWEEISKAIRETVLSDRWDEEDWKMDQQEGRIATLLNLEFSLIYPRKERQSNPQVQSPNLFSYPGIHSIKLNFDGASKGNPGPAGLGGIFRDGKGKTRWVFAEWVGEMTNNDAELWAVHEGLRIAVRNRYLNLEIEGDSQITIEMLRRLKDGQRWDKVAKSWRTAAIIKDIEELLNKIDYKTIKHVRRDGNKAADFLANWGSKEAGSKLDRIWTSLESDHSWDGLKTILNHDHEEATKHSTGGNLPPDRVG